MRAEIGMVFDRAFPAGSIGDYARRVEDAFIDQLWLIEDCFYTTAVSLAATALASTERITVGLGVLPAVARTAAFTAMEIATLANLGPGRLVAGIGHGVQEWMGQMGVRPASPLTALDETISNVRRLLAGEEVSFDGRYVHLDRVQLEQPPSVVPPVLAGVQQPKSMALAGRVADGVVLGEGIGPSFVRWAREQAGDPPGFRFMTFTMMAVSDDRREAYGWVSEFVAGMVLERRPSLTVLPFFDELDARVVDGGHAALHDMPVDYWRELGAIGTWDDALAHVAALEAEGVSSINVFPGPSLDLAWQQMADVARLAAR
jgi:5,10-methylenetetrahydromethanopterin reductase